MSLDARFGKEAHEAPTPLVSGSKGDGEEGLEETDRESNEKSTDVSAADVEKSIKHEGFQPSDGGMTLAEDLDGVRVKHEAGGRSLGKTRPYLYETG